MPDELIIGMMSGTSVDGIDAALVSFNSVNELRVIGTAVTQFEPALKTRINAVALSPIAVSKEQHDDLDQELADLYARAALSLLRETGYKVMDIRVIANHGQTVQHEPTANPPISVQLGNPQRIADLSGIPTVGYFRQADLAEGGQGAPLMPAFHQAMFDYAGTETAILNIGGIANLTRLGETVRGFDTGPGNTLMDQWIYRKKQEDCDREGQWAKTGKVNLDALRKLLADPYFALPTPKSTGTDYFNLDWLEKTLGPLEDFVAQDLQATLLALTVESVAIEVERLIADERFERLYICGGGAHNKRLMSKLKRRLPDVRLRKTDHLGIDVDWVEAIGFAWLGYCHLHQIPSNLPSVTGAARQVVLGELFRPR